MAEELQALIERIQREAVDTGEQQAAKIVTQAREKAAALVKEAETKAASIVENAKRDAEQYVLRGEQALAQSARDLLISVGKGVEKIFENLVSDAVHGSLDAGALTPILTKAVEAYLKEGGKAGALEVVLSKDDRATLENHFKQRFGEALAQGMTVHTDARMSKGFKIRRRDKHIEHDFSKEAIAEAVSNFLRPALAETVYKISREM